MFLLKGGVTVTVPYENSLDTDAHGKILILKDFPNNEIVVRSLRSSGNSIGIIVEADIDGTNKGAGAKIPRLNRLINQSGLEQDRLRN